MSSERCIKCSKMFHADNITASGRCGQCEFDYQNQRVQVAAVVLGRELVLPITNARARHIMREVLKQVDAVQ